MIDELQMVNKGLWSLTIISLCLVLVLSFISSVYSVVILFIRNDEFYLVKAIFALLVISSKFYAIYGT